MTADMERTDDPYPDPRLLWRWAGMATRPWIGWVFIGLSSLFVLLGYVGVAGEVIVSKQIPYLASGGLGGVILAVVGAYFLATEQLRKDSGRLDRLEEVVTDLDSMVTEVHAALFDQPDTPELASARTRGSTNGDASTEVVIVEGGEHFHNESCPMAEGKAIKRLTRKAAGARRLRACPLCDPSPTG